LNLVFTVPPQKSFGTLCAFCTSLNQRRFGNLIRYDLIFRSALSNLAQAVRGGMFDSALVDEIKMQGRERIGA